MLEMIIEFAEGGIQFVQEMVFGSIVGLLTAIFVTFASLGVIGVLFAVGLFLLAVAVFCKYAMKHVINAFKVVASKWQKV